MNRGRLSWAALDRVAAALDVVYAETVTIYIVEDGYANSAEPDTVLGIIKVWGDGTSRTRWLPQPAERRGR